MCRIEDFEFAFEEFKDFEVLNFKATKTQSPKAVCFL